MKKTFDIGGLRTIVRLGYGAMRITGPGIWGPPRDRRAAIETLQAVPELGVNFVDTADSYGPNVSEELIREALHPYPGLTIATKAGFVRKGPDVWVPRGDPAHLIAQAKASRDRLGVAVIDLWQLHRIDPMVPADEQFSAIRELIDTRIVAQAGLSEVTVDEIKAASRYFDVATVQNRYNLTDRASDDVLQHCEAHGIGFIPWFPLGAGSLLAADGVLDEVAQRYDATAGQIAIAWLLAKSAVMIPIPGTSRLAHLKQNVHAAEIALSAEDFALLDALVVA